MGWFGAVPWSSATTGTRTRGNALGATAGGYVRGARTCVGSVTSVVATLTVREPMALSQTNFLGISNSKFIFRVVNTTNMPKFVVEASTNLSTWSALSTNVPTKDFFDVTNTVSATVPYQFYRSKEQ